MTPRVFFAALRGKREHDDKHLEALRNLIYGSSRYNAQSIVNVWSGKAAKQIARQKFPWEKGSSSSKRDSFDVLTEKFKSIAVPEEKED